MLKGVIVLAFVATAAAVEKKTNWADPQKGLERPKTYVFKDTLVNGMKPVSPTTWTDETCPKCQFREHEGELVVEVVHGNYADGRPAVLLGADIKPNAGPRRKHKLGNQLWNPAENHMCYAESIDSQDPSLCPNDSGVKGYVFSHNGRWKNKLAGKGRGFFEDTASVNDCALKCDDDNACDSFARFRDGECYLYSSSEKKGLKGYRGRGKEEKLNGCWHWWTSVADAQLSNCHKDKDCHQTPKCAEEPTKNCQSRDDECTSSPNKDDQVVYSKKQWADKGENVADWVAFEKCREGVGLVKRAKQGIPDELGTNKCVCVCGDTTKEFTYNGKYMTETKRFIHGHGTISPEGNLRAKQLAIDQYQKGKKAGASVFYGRNYGNQFKKSFVGKSNGIHESKFNNEGYKSNTKPQKA